VALAERSAAPELPIQPDRNRNTFGVKEQGESFNLRFPDDTFRVRSRASSVPAPAKPLPRARSVPCPGLSARGSRQGGNRLQPRPLALFLEERREKSSLIS